MNPDDFDAKALVVLRRLVGRDDATFHDGQLEAIRSLVVDRQRALVVQRTGWGKSAVYFVATALLRAAGAGPTVIVSPLLALMRDQIAAATRAGITAVTINTANAAEWSDVHGALAADAVDVLLVSPERLNNPSFRERQRPDLAARLKGLEASIPVTAMREANWQVDRDADKQTPAQAARWLAVQIEAAGK